MIAVDTGPLVALFDKDDHYHKVCVDILKEIHEPLITTWPVLTEVTYLLSFSVKAQNLCLEFIKSGGVDIYPGNVSQIPRISELMLQYHDLPMDLADASLVLLAEENNLTTIFTLDHKDFRLYISSHAPSFHLIPEQL